MSKLEFITAEVCPFAQRSHLALLEKSLDFDHLEVDLSNKPAWFEQASPYSKVPVLRDGDTRVYESSIINEYLEEVFPQRALMPADPAGRAEARIWIDFDNVKLVPTQYRALLAQNPDEQRRHAEDLIGHLEFLESAGFASHEGPYWFGNALSLVDLSLYPHFERFAVLTEYRGIRIPAACGRLRAWLKAMGERDSVRATAHDDAYHVSAYAKYADNSASGTTARDMRG